MDVRSFPASFSAMVGSTGKKTLSITDSMSQEILADIASKYPKLESLDICLEYEDNPEEVDFSSVRFPVLKQLSLSAVGLRSLVFNQSNTPLLESLHLSNCMGENIYPFVLDLPELTRFSAEHTCLGDGPDTANQVGLSLSRCPKLEFFGTYKFRNLGESNYCVLPSMTYMSFYRSECTTHFEILYAPKLEELELRAAYDLDHVRLFNKPSVSVDQISTLGEAYQQAHEVATTKAREEQAKWRSGVYGIKRALKLHWIEDPSEWESVERLEEIGLMDEHLDEVFQRALRSKLAVVRAQCPVLNAPNVKDESLPEVSVDCTNMNLSRSSLRHLKNNSRVKLIRIESDEFGSGMGGPHLFESMLEGDDIIEEEEVPSLEGMLRTMQKGEMPPELEQMLQAVQKGGVPPVLERVLQTLRDEGEISPEVDDVMLTLQKGEIPTEMNDMVRTLQNGGVPPGLIDMLQELREEGGMPSGLVGMLRTMRHAIEEEDYDNDDEDEEEDDESDDGDKEEEAAAEEVEEEPKRKKLKNM